MNVKISEMTSATSLDGTELVPIVQSGVSKKVTSLEMQKPIQDTGWIDISSYLNTGYFAKRDDVAPKVRRIGNLVYFIGEIYCKSSVGSNQATLFSNIPSYFRPPDQYTRGGVRFKSNPFTIFASTGGTIEVAETSSITVQNSYQGYPLSNLDGMLVTSDFPTNL